MVEVAIFSTREPSQAAGMRFPSTAEQCFIAKLSSKPFQELSFEGPPGTQAYLFYSNQSAGD